MLFQGLLRSRKRKRGGGKKVKGKEIMNSLHPHLCRRWEKEIGFCRFSSLINGELSHPSGGETEKEEGESRYAEMSSK